MPDLAPVDFLLTLIDTESVRYSDLARLTGHAQLGVYDVLLLVANTTDETSYNGLREVVDDLARARAKALAAERKALRQAAAQEGGLSETQAARSRRLRALIQKRLPIVILFGNTPADAGADVVVSPDEGASFAAGIDAYYIQGDAASPQDGKRVLDECLRAAWRAIGDFDPRDAPRAGALIPGPENDPKLRALLEDPMTNRYPERNMNAPPTSSSSKSSCVVS